MSIFLDMLVEYDEFQKNCEVERGASLSPRGVRPNSSQMQVLATSRLLGWDGTKSKL